jgi:thioredoxin-like negative regulator of GroEL
LDLGALSKFLRRSEVWIIYFYKPEDPTYEKYKNIWKELAEKYYGIFKVSAINCSDEEELC